MSKKRAALKILQWSATAAILHGCNVNGSTPKAVIQDDSVTADKMADNAIATRSIQTGAVTTEKIADQAVTAAKLDPAISLSGVGGTFSGAVSVGTTLTVTGATTLNSTLSVATSFALNTNKFTIGNAGDLAINTNKFTVAGATGITTIAGTLSVADTVSITKTDVSTAAGNVYGVNNALTLNPAAGTAATYYGGLDSVSMSSAQNATSTIFAHTGYVNNTNSGTMSLGYGGYSLAQQSGAGTMTAAVGVYGLVTNTSTGAIGTGYALRGSLTNSGGGAVTNYHGLHLDDPGTGIAAGQYNIYSAGNVYNYIAGRLGVANTTPTYQLDVTGDINTTTQLRIAGVVMCTAAGCTAVSDSHLKEQAEPLTGSLDKVLKLQGISYYFKNKKVFGDKKQIGFSAQDLEKQFPEVVRTDKDTGLKTVAYDHLIAPLVEAVKELVAKFSADHEQLGQQKQQIAQLEKKIELENLALKAENKALKERLDKIEIALAQAAPQKALTKKGRKLASQQ